MNLSEQKCVPCEGGIPPLEEDKIGELQKQVDPAWEVIENKKIKRDFEFKDFVQSMEFINNVADIAEEQGHHPNIHVFYNKVTLELWTHAINGLFTNDFILAAKIDKIADEMK
jgi:4a-hydroxytetrahydrobiopterin dehydratase